MVGCAVEVVVGDADCDGAPERVGVKVGTGVRMVGGAVGLGEGGMTGALVGRGVGDRVGGGVGLLVGASETNKSGGRTSCPSCSSMYSIFIILLSKARSSWEW